jgi:DNA repair protein RadC
MSETTLNLFETPKTPATAKPAREIYRGFELRTTVMRVMEPETNLSARSPEDTRKICADMADLAQESFVVLLLNTRNRVIDKVMITLGIMDCSLVHPREVFRPAILKNACAIILVHNHPSGDPSPSADDLRVTKQLVEAGKIIGIKILDHVIIGRRSDEQMKDFCSLRETGMSQFE